MQMRDVCGLGTYLTDRHRDIVNGLGVGWALKFRIGLVVVPACSESFVGPSRTRKW